MPETSNDAVCDSAPCSPWLLELTDRLLDQILHCLYPGENRECGGDPSQRTTGGVFDELQSHRQGDRATSCGSNSAHDHCVGGAN